MARFAFRTRQWKGLLKKERKKGAFWQLWNRNGPEYGSDPLSLELVLIKKKLADEKLCLCELRLEKKRRTKYIKQALNL